MAKTSQELAAAAAGITIEDMGEKVRVHALAKALDVPSAELVQVLTGQGIEGKRATSTLPKAQVGELLAALTAAGAPAEADKTAPAKRTRKAAAKKTAPKKATAKKATAKKTTAKKTTAKTAPAEDMPAEDALVEAAAPEQAAESQTPAKRARTSSARKTAPKSDAAPNAEAKAGAKRDETTTAEPGKTRARKAPAKKTAKKTAPTKSSATTASTKKSALVNTAPEKSEPAVPAMVDTVAGPAKEQAGTQTTTRRPRRGRKATAAATVEATTTDEPAIAGTVSAAPTGDTVDALIDRIAESVEAPEPAEATQAATKTVRQPSTPTTDKATNEDGGPVAEEERPRTVRRRVVRRVGSRNAASDAELLRSRKAEQLRATEATGTAETAQATETADNRSAASSSDTSSDTSDGPGNRGHRRGRRGRGRGRGDQDRYDESRESQDNRTDRADNDAPEQPREPADDHGVPEDLPVLTEGADIVEEPVKLKGSTRLESKKRWRQEQGHDKKKVVSKAEFLARRENVDRAMVVRDSERSDHPGTTTQVGITEDGMLVEHFVTSETQSSIIGNIYLGRVQNVLSSMEAAFIDIGTGRNAVLYAGEVDWRNKHLHTRTRRIEAALKPGDQVLVQAIKDPLGHKGARLTNRLSFAGRYLVYVPGGKTQGISRKLPESERKRLKEILGRVVPDNGGTIIRTAAEGVSEELIAEDVNRLHQRWIDIQDSEEKARARKGSHPVTMYEEPNMLVKVIRDIFNEDFNELVVDGEKSWAVVRDYVHRIAPDLESRVVRYHPDQHGGRDVFEDRQLDEQLAKALSRKVWLPSGGYLIIDRTEAMTVIDVNTGSFVGSGGNLEETVTLNNLEAAEEIVRQMRLRDMGGMIVVDFIDMVLPENRDLMLRRLSEFLGRDRTRHKVSEVTSLGLVQMTRKRLGTGLLETFSTECPTCGGRGVIIHADPVEHVEEEDDHHDRRDHGHRAEKRQARDQQETRRRHERNREDDTSWSAGTGDGHTSRESHGDRVGLDSRDSREEHVARESGASESSEAVQPSHGRTRRTRRGSRSGGAGHTPEQAPEKVTGKVAERAAERAVEQAAEQPVAKTEVREATHTASGSAAESHGSRRGRRRVVRRVENEQHESSRPEQREHSDHRGLSDRSDRSDRSNVGDVTAIAVQAVAHAGIEDPDEPTGADYVPNESQEQEQAPVSAPESVPGSGTDRRGRRRVRRVVRPAEGRAPEQKGTEQKGTERKASERKSPEQKRPQRKSQPKTRKDDQETGPVATSGARSFAEAKAEFDASPRRRRRTRGRSRSDVAPEPADFGGAGAASEVDSTPASTPERVEKSGPAAVASPSKGGVPKQSQGTTVTSGAPASRRGRRRVVRSSR